MDFAKALSDMKSFAMTAGALAVENQQKITVQLKNGKDALTETDLAVSKMAYDYFGDWLAMDGHILIDEESTDQIGKPDEVFANSTYQWVLDPVDGTAGYAMGRSLWGITLALLKNGEPLLGIIYLPAMKDMLVADLDKAVWIRNVGTPDAFETPLSVRDMELYGQTFVESYFGAGMAWDEKWSRKIWINRPESAIQGFFSALVGQAAGATMINKFSIWDVAAAVVLAKRSGYQVRGMAEDRLLTSFTGQDFQDNWKLKTHWLLSSEKNYAYLRDAIIGV